jgi:hypothetical protein
LLRLPLLLDPPLALLFAALDFAELPLLFAALLLALLLFEPPVLEREEEEVVRLLVERALPSSPITGRFFLISPALSMAPSRTFPAASLTFPAALLTAEPAPPRACIAPPATSPSFSLAFPSTSGTPPEDLDLLLDLRVVLLFFWAICLPPSYVRYRH